MVRCWGLKIVVLKTGQDSIQGFCEKPLFDQNKHHTSGHGPKIFILYSSFSAVDVLMLFAATRPRA